MERNETLAVKWYNQIDYNQTTREILRLQSDQLHSKETNVMERKETLAVKWYNRIDYDQTTDEILRLQSDQQNSNETNPIERKKHKMREILT